MARTQEYTDESMIVALRQTKGMVYDAADIVGCCADTIYERAKESPAVKEAMKRERGKFVDKCQRKLDDAVEAGEPWAIQMGLKTLGKDRGFVEREERTGKDGAPLNPAIVRIISPPGSEALDANGLRQRQSLNGHANGHTNGDS